MSLAVDHVIVCVPDLDKSVAAFEREQGVTSVPGGRHDDHGTANRLVPLGEAYIELVAVVDPDEAAESPFGTWVGARARHPGADGLAIATDDLDAVCQRLNLEAVGMSRTNATGDHLRWRIAGLETMVSVGLPFFIHWEMTPELHPGRIPVSHPAGDVGLGTIRLSGNTWQLQAWIGDVPGVEIAHGIGQIEFAVT